MAGYTTSNRIARPSARATSMPSAAVKIFAAGEVANSKPPSSFLRSCRPVTSEQGSRQTNTLAEIGLCRQPPPEDRIPRFSCRSLQNHRKPDNNAPFPWPSTIKHLDVGAFVGDPGCHNHAGARTGPIVVSAAKPSAVLCSDRTLPTTIFAPYSSAWVRNVRSNTSPEIPSAKPGWLWLLGMEAALLLPASITSTRLRNRAR